jgi:hypothetical protein
MSAEGVRRIQAGVVHRPSPSSAALAVIADLDLRRGADASSRQPKEVFAVGVGLRGVDGDDLEPPGFGCPPPPHNVPAAVTRATYRSFMRGADAGLAVFVKRSGCAGGCSGGR